MEGKVLLIDDAASLGSLLQAISGEGLRIQATSKVSVAVESLHREHVDVAIVGDIHTDADPVSLLELLARDNLAPRCILLTRSMSGEALVRAFNVGRAFRILRRPVDPNELRSAVKNALESPPKYTQPRGQY